MKITKTEKSSLNDISKQCRTKQNVIPHSKYLVILNLCSKVY